MLFFVLHFDGPPTRPAAFVSVNARSADSFVDTIGVNTHVSYLDRTYAHWNDIVFPKLLASGIRHVRDGAYTYSGIDGNNYVFQNLRALTGIKFDLVTDWNTKFAVLPNIQNWLNGNVESFEGVNEPDLQGDPTWASDTIAQQKGLYSAVKGSFALSGVKVLGPSPAFTFAPLGNLAAYADWGNFHPYPGGAMPSTGLDADIANSTVVTGGVRPMIATETGYHNALQDPNPDQPPISLTAGGKYFPRLLLDHFSRNIVRTYVYEFMDETTNLLTSEQQCFGIIGGDGTEKPAYKSIKNLIALASDPGFIFIPGSLNMSMTGGDSNTRTVLLQKRDGSFWLAAWEEVPSWNTTTKTDISNPAVPLKLSFDQNFGTIRTYLPGSSTSATSSVHNVNSININNLDEVTLIELRPQVCHLLEIPINGLNGWISALLTSLSFDLAQVSATTQSISALDSMYLLGQPSSDLATLSCHVASSPAGSEGGLIIKSSTAPGSTYFAIGQSATGTIISYRSSQNGEVATIPVTGSWLRMERIRSTLNISSSTDGKIWSTVHLHCLFPKSTLVGLYGTISAGQENIVFDQASVNGVNLLTNTVAIP